MEEKKFKRKNKSEKNKKKHTERCDNKLGTEEEEEEVRYK